MFCNEQTFCEVTCLCVTALQQLLLLNLCHDAVRNQQQSAQPNINVKIFIGLSSRCGEIVPNLLQLNRFELRTTPYSTTSHSWQL